MTWMPECQRCRQPAPFLPAEGQSHQWFPDRVNRITGIFSRNVSESNKTSTCPEAPARPQNMLGGPLLRSATLLRRSQPEIGSPDLRVLENIGRGAAQDHPPGLQ